MKIRFYILSFIIGAIVPTMCIVKNIEFSQNCSGYLKQTADAITVESALERITMAIDYLDAHNLTSGYTSVIYKTEDDNIGFWYNNLRNCKSELEDALDGSQLEKTNTLMNVREALTDEGEKGTVFTIPDGIWKYPHNKILAFLNTISVILMCSILIPIGKFLYD